MKSLIHCSHHSHKHVRSIYISKTALASLVIATLATVFSHKVEAENLFEGYYKVTLSGQHAGYVIQSYDFDAAKKLFTGKYFTYVRLSPDGKQFLNESLTAKANDKYQPVSYEYSGIIGSVNEVTKKPETKITTIDATFKGQKMFLKGIKNGKNLSQNAVYPKGAFLSNFLIYLMLQNGFKVGKNFEFSAISEEEGVVQKGRVQIVAEETFKNVSAFRINWTFKDMESASFISTSGNALATESPAQKVAQELVATPSEATTGFPFPQQSIKKVFGAIPGGSNNIMSQQKSGKPAANPANVLSSATPGTPSVAAPAQVPALPDAPPPAVIVKPGKTKGP